MFIHMKCIYVCLHTCIHVCLYTQCMYIVCIYMYIYIHMNRHICIHKYVRIYKCLCLYIYMYINVCIDKYIDVYTSIHVNNDVFMYICTCIQLHVEIFIYSHLYIYIHTSSRHRSWDGRTWGNTAGSASIDTQHRSSACRAHGTAWRGSSKAPSLAKERATSSRGSRSPPTGGPCVTSESGSQCQ